MKLDRKLMILPAVAMFLLVGCQSYAGSDSSLGMSEREISLQSVHPEARTTPGWLNPKTMQVEVASRAPEPGDMYINGILVGWRFVATSEVMGTLQAPPIASRCRPVWLVLEDRSIVEQKDSGAPPERTHLGGLFDPETGLFYPSSSHVVRVAAPQAAAGDSLDG